MKPVLMWNLSAIFLTLLARSLVCDASSKVQIKPRTALVLEGEPATFNATFNITGTEGIRWSYVPANGIESDAIYQTYPPNYNYNRTKYTIENRGNGTFSFTINKVEQDDAGQYRFGFIVDNKHRKMADLVVVSRPEAILEDTEYITGETGSFVCEVNYASRTTLEERYVPTLSAKVGDTEITSGDLKIATPQPGTLLHHLTLEFQTQLPDDPCLDTTEFYCIVEKTKPKFKATARKVIQLENKANVTTDHCEESGASMATPSLLLPLFIALLY